MDHVDRQCSCSTLQGKATGTYVHFDPAQDGIERQTLTIRGPMLKVYRAHALLMKRYHETHETQAEAAWIWNESAYFDLMTFDALMLFLTSYYGVLIFDDF